tara:strand:+ start:266 stop:637 length:372 start_codon:yes stop_codon:yes gene_type:complete
MFKIEDTKLTCLYCEDEENKEYFNKRIEVLTMARNELKKFKSVKEYRESKYKVLKRRRGMVPDYVKDYSCDDCKVKTQKNYRICVICRGRTNWTCQTCNILIRRISKYAHLKSTKHLKNLNDS